MSSVANVRNSAAFEPDASRAGECSSFSTAAYPFVLELSGSCHFDENIFLDVMMNLMRNPNLTSSHLFRADILYDSVNDASFALSSSGPELTTFSKHMKSELRPLPFSSEGYEHRRLIVRKLIPRNPQLDKFLVQTCHFLECTSDATNENMQLSALVVLLPHSNSPTEIPFYHPPVRGLAVLFESKNDLYQRPVTAEDSASSNGRAFSAIVSIHRTDFPTEDSLNLNESRIRRTFQRLLGTIHKHGNGKLIGYQKRVQHDQIIAQRRFQDTYSMLKAKYARSLIQNWSENTDPTKHVFEDIGIAAFCLEVFREMYAIPSTRSTSGQEEENILTDETVRKAPFPGFLDIGCGNGVLVYILRNEGYDGFGLDARKRKTWLGFQESMRPHLRETCLIPNLFYEVLTSNGPVEDDPSKLFIFPTPTGLLDTTQKTVPRGIFLISNHADELTLWTPLLARMNNSPFLCIPCCSHDFGGLRFRVPARKAFQDAQKPVTTPRDNASITGEQGATYEPSGITSESSKIRKSVQPSAYACLVAYVERISSLAGFTVEKEMLRIPSTRNACILARSWSNRVSDFSQNSEIVELVEQEMGRSIFILASEWMLRIQKLSKIPSSGHTG